MFSQPHKKIGFLSRYPDNFYKKMAEKVKQKAYAANDWIDIGSLKDDKYHTKYEGQEFGETLYITDNAKNIHILPVRLFVYRSLDGTNRIEKRLNKEEKRIMDQKVVIEKKVLPVLKMQKKLLKNFINPSTMNSLILKPQLVQRLKKVVDVVDLVKIQDRYKAKQLGMFRLS